MVEGNETMSIDWVAEACGGSDEHWARVNGDLYGDRVYFERDALLARLKSQDRIREALVGWLAAIVNEADEYDDHDGKLGHIAYSTLVQARAYLASLTP